ncbi:MAG: class I SAM-dependent methyltransferase [Ilumatobacteraceae bacterium]
MTGSADNDYESVIDAAPSVGYYESLEFNAPMSTTLADELATLLSSRTPAIVVDIGCGWAELLLRVLAMAPLASGLGVDADVRVLARANANAGARHLDDRVTFTTELPEPGSTADVVICVGADHIYGPLPDALVNLQDLLSPGGVLLLGTGYWETTPTVEQAASIGARPDDHRDLADLVDLAMGVGFRLLGLRTATRREWEQFEFGYLADWENWLMKWSHDAMAPRIRAQADTHRNEYLRGWREVLGFAYLVLGKAQDQT